MIAQPHTLGIHDINKFFANQTKHSTNPNPNPNPNPVSQMLWLLLLLPMLLRRLLLMLRLDYLGGGFNMCSSIDHEPYVKEPGEP